MSEILVWILDYYVYIGAPESMINQIYNSLQQKLNNNVKAEDYLHDNYFKTYVRYKHAKIQAWVNGRWFNDQCSSAKVIDDLPLLSKKLTEIFPYNKLTVHSGSPLFYMRVEILIMYVIKRMQLSTQDYTAIAEFVSQMQADEKALLGAFKLKDTADKKTKLSMLKAVVDELSYIMDTYKRLNIQKTIAETRYTQFMNVEHTYENFKKSLSNYCDYIMSKLDAPVLNSLAVFTKTNGDNVLSIDQINSMITSDMNIIDDYYAIGPTTFNSDDENDDNGEEKTEEEDDEDRRR